MSFDASLYRERPAIKERVKRWKSLSECARRLGYVPSTFRAKLNGDAPMDAAEEKKILADLAAMMEAA